MDRRFLIVGQGIAGTMLSWQLFKKDIPHMVMDDGHVSSSSTAAAGLINPITGRRYVKSWMIDELLPFADQCFLKIQKELDISILKKRRILRTFHDQSQVNLWNESTSRPGYEEHITNTEEFSYSGIVKEPLGFGVISKGSLVDINQLLSSYKTFLLERGMLIKSAFSYPGNTLDAEAVKIGDESFTDIIFSEGYKVTENPYFNYLPFQPAKGESMIIQVDTQLPVDILRDNIFIVPLDETHFWTGGGYDRKDRSLEPDENWKSRWIAKLDELLEVDYRVVTHNVGVRPSVTDRRPLVGTHPDHSRIHLFNGMGTKGTSLAPYWANKFVEHLLNGTPLDEAVSLERFNT